MGRNYQNVQRGYRRSREKEWTQALVDEDYYEELVNASIGGGDPGVSVLMAGALERQPAPPSIAEHPEPQPIKREPRPTEPPPTRSPYEALAGMATVNSANGTVRRLWNRLVRMMG